MSNTYKVNFMKKQKGSRTLNVLKSVFDVRRWIDYDRLKFFTLYLGKGFKKMFVPQKSEGKSKTFTETVERLSLVDQDLEIKQRALWRLSMLMLVLALAIMVYSAYHFIQGSYRAAIMSLVVSMIGLVLAFRYHFWYFQIKERKLGCSFMEWFRQGLLGEKHD